MRSVVPKRIHGKAAGGSAGLIAALRGRHGPNADGETTRDSAANAHRRLTRLQNLGSIAAMKTRSMVLALGLCVVAGAVCVAADSPQMGTWKLNEAKSKLDPNGPKNNTVVYSATGDQMKVTVDGVDAKGKAIHSAWTGMFDGKDHPVTGNPAEDTRAYKKIDDRTLEFTAKKDGKVIISGKVVVATDGKSRTVTSGGTNAEGKKFENKAVYDKQ